MKFSAKRLKPVFAFNLALLLFPIAAIGQRYTQTNLVSNTGMHQVRNSRACRFSLPFAA